MKYLISFLLILSTCTVFGQDVKLDEHYKKDVIEKLSVLIQDFYVYPEIAQKTSDYLIEQFNNGYFDEYSDNTSFAEALTDVVQIINKDKHMRIMVNQQYEAPENTLERQTEQRMNQINNFRNFNHGFKELKLLEGNVAYLDLRGFANFDWGKETADSFMKLMSLSDTIIFDLTKNGGGDPSMVQYLCSYFFDKKLHLNSLYYREGDRTEEYWTLDDVDGKKMADIPLFIMIGEETFSGAEEFAYNMQTQKRATLIGETTKGGANPGGTRGINEFLSVFIPTGRAINPITNTNWEGVGVIPEIRTKPDETFNRALVLAQEAADLKRKHNHDTYYELHKKLNLQLVEYVKGESEKNINNALKDFVDSRLFGEWDINNLGYDYLHNRNKPKLGLCILAANTTFFPESPNVYDSYGEALKVNGDLKGAVENYKKAVELAVKYDDKNIEQLKERLQKAQEEYKNQK